MFYIICLSEIYRDSKTLPEDENLDISLYKIARADQQQMWGNMYLLQRTFAFENYKC